MVRRSLAGAVLALVGGSAVATALGVIHLATDPTPLRSAQVTPSQRVSYEARFTPVVRAHLGGPAPVSPLAIGNIQLPEFMTRDVLAKPTIRFASALTTMVTGDDATLVENQAQAAKFGENSLAAATIGGPAGGYAYAYSGAQKQPQSTLSVDLNTSGVEANARRFANAATISGSPATRGGSPSLNRPFSGPASTSPTIDNEAARIPEVASPSSNRSAASNPGVPTMNGNANPLPTPSVVSSLDDAPVTGSNVPAPGAGVIAGLGGLALVTRRRNA